MKKNKSQSGELEAAVGKILDLRASRVRALALKVSRLKKRLAVSDLQETKAGAFKKY